MEEDDVDAFRSMSRDEGEDEDVDFGAIMRQIDDGSTGVLSTIDKVLSFAENARNSKIKTELDDRAMVKGNHMVTMHAVLHRPGQDDQNFRVDVMASAQFANIQKAIIERMGAHWDASWSMRMTWLKDDGAQIALSQTTWRDYIFTMWCSQPWVVHVHQAGPEDVVEMPLERTAWTLFERYDVNRNGVIERVELARMVKDVRLERFECSPALIERFVTHEFDRLDIDGSGGIDRAEFTRYVTRMTSWMRTELLELSNESAMFDHLAGKAVEGIFPATFLPNDDSMDDEDEVAIVKTSCFGIRLEVPVLALPDAKNLQISVRTISDSTVSYLSDDTVQAPPGSSADFGRAMGGQAKVVDLGSLAEGEALKGFYNLPFSPIVRVDFPAFENGEPPELGTERASPFSRPITLVLPHSFDPRKGEEAIAMLGGAPHGATGWEPVASGATEDAGGITLKGQGARPPASTHTPMRI